jgi:GT2 family glycosyltransferase
VAAGLKVFSGILHRSASFAAWVADCSRRLRYRRADLRRMPAVEMVSDPRAGAEAFRWLPEVRMRGRPRAALMCRSNSHVSYDMMLPPRSIVTTWCALAPESWTDQTGGVEFEIRVRSERREVSARRLINPGTSSRDQRWQALRVETAEAGPARIVLATRLVGDAPADALCPLWGDPGVQAPRSLGELASALRSAVSQWGIRALWHGTLPANADRFYSLWVRENGPSRKALRAQRQWSLTRTRSFSLMTFVADPSAWRARRTAASVHDQSYPAWEWMLIAPEDSSHELVKAVARIPRDERVRMLTVPPGNTRAEAWNAALREARGEFAAILGSDDVVAPAALYEMARELERQPDCDVLYSDEDRISPRDVRRHEPHFKPDWSPELLLASNYIGRLAMIRVSAAIAAGGFRQCGDAEEWDLFLRLSRRDARIHRVPRCLYHQAQTDVSSGHEPSNDAVRDHCQQRGLSAVVSTSPGGYRVVWPVRGQPKVSVIIPNRDAPVVLKECLRGLLHNTSYPHRELVIVDNGTTEPEALELYRSLERDGCGTIVPFDRPFNFSAACNAGAAVARGELLLFLNNDIEVIHPDWLEELVRWSQLPAVGIVGAKLLYPDRTIQHAGVAFGLGLVGHIFSRAPEGTSGVFGSCESYRNYLAVTGACQMIRKDVFQQLGGYDERFGLSFSDVVLCMEAWKAGYRVVYTPYACLVHHESHTRKRDDSAQDMELLARYLQDRGFAEDPYFHPELNPKSSIPAVRPPFDPTPRQVVRDYVDRVLLAAAAHHESGRR